MPGVCMDRLVGPLTLTANRTEHIDPLNFGTGLDQKIIGDRIGPDRFNCDDISLEGLQLELEECVSDDMHIFDKEWKASAEVKIKADQRKLPLLMRPGTIIQWKEVAESKLAKFVDDIIVPPRMIDIIVDGEEEVVLTGQESLGLLGWITLKMKLQHQYVISFLKEHGKEIYVEVRAAYIDTMNKYLVTLRPSWEFEDKWLGGLDTWFIA
ncbi:hypothetical protein LguiA_036204 [Lonicera macranthoides]